MLFVPAAARIAFRCHRATSAQSNELVLLTFLPGCYKDSTVLGRTRMPPTIGTSRMPAATFAIPSFTAQPGNKHICSTARALSNNNQRQQPAAVAVARAGLIIAVACEHAHLCGKLLTQATRQLQTTWNKCRSLIRHLPQEGTCWGRWLIGSSSVGFEKRSANSRNGGSSCHQLPRLPQPMLQQPCCA